jgi:hypothetical protein
VCVCVLVLPSMIAHVLASLTVQIVLVSITAHVLVYVHVSVSSMYMSLSTCVTASLGVCPMARGARGSDSIYLELFFE